MFMCVLSQWSLAHLETEGRKEVEVRVRWRQRAEGTLWGKRMYKIFVDPLDYVHSLHEQSMYSYQLKMLRVEARKQRSL